VIELRLSEAEALLVRDALQHRLAAWRTADRYFPALSVERGVDVGAEVERLESLLITIPAPPDTTTVT
jgi:hypothetical protein